MPLTTVAAQLAQLLQAMRNCEQSNNHEWEQKHAERIDQIVRDFLPSGSGVDNGTKLDTVSDYRKLVLTFEFHHMNETGMCGWTEHRAIVTPAFDGIDIRITGRDRNGSKEYLYDIYHAALTTVIEYDTESNRYGSVEQ